MNTRTSTEIINEFLSKHSFSTVFVEKNFPLALVPTYSRMSNHESIEFLMNSALTGNKVIGFFNRLPLFKPSRLIRGECIFVTTRLPEKITVPALFCRYPDELPQLLPLAQKVSFETNLPIVIVMSDNVTHNYSAAPLGHADVDRISPYISEKSIRSLMDEVTFQGQLAKAGKVLQDAIPNRAFEGSRISFSDPAAEFFRFLVPCAKCELKGGMHTLSSIETLDTEHSFMTYVMNELHMMDIPLSTYSGEKPYDTKRYLCPGCPFVALFRRMKLDGYVVFTDVQCEGILETYPMHYMELPSYLGLISKKLNMQTLFIGNSSNFNVKYADLLEHGSVILLGDIERGSVPGFSSIKYPWRVRTVRNAIFPYSCSNIKKYSVIKVREKKCVCPKANGEPLCLKETRCPALIPGGSSIRIDTTLCTGCETCKTACPHGALR